MTTWGWLIVPWSPGANGQSGSHHPEAAPRPHRHRRYTSANGDTYDPEPVGRAVVPTTAAAGRPTPSGAGQCRDGDSAAPATPIDPSENPRSGTSAKYNWYIPLPMTNSPYRTMDDNKRPTEDETLLEGPQPQEPRD